MVESALILAAISAGISLLSLSTSILTGWNAAKSLGIARAALDNNLKLQQEFSEKEMMRLKKELLDKFADEIKLYKKLYLDLGASKANYDAAPKEVKDLLKHYSGLVTETFPKIEDTKEFLEQRWNIIHKWKIDINYEEMILDHATAYKDLKDTEVNYDNFKDLLFTFKAKLNLAREYHKKAKPSQSIESNNNENVES